MSYKVSTRQTSGGVFVTEHTHLRPGGPPLHYHLSQEEWFYVIEGEVVFQVGDQRIHLHPGESVLAPRLIPHTFSCVSETPGRMLIAFVPAGKMEAYFNDAAAAGGAKVSFEPAFMRGPSAVHPASARPLCALVVYQAAAEPGRHLPGERVRD